MHSSSSWRSNLRKESWMDFKKTHASKDAAAANKIKIELCKSTALITLAAFVISISSSTSLANSTKSTTKHKPLSKTSSPSSKAPLAKPKETNANTHASTNTSVNSSTDASTKSSQLKPGTKEFLWKMVSDSGATLYLLGTIHIVKSDFYPLAPEMEKAFQKSRAILMEIDMSKTDQQKLQLLLRQIGLYQPPDSLLPHLSPDLEKEVKLFCERNKLPFENAIKMKPWLLSITILQAELQRLGYNSKDGIDLHFTAEAKEQGKKIIGLETEEFQLNLFASLPDELQDQMLNLTFVDMGLLEEDAGKLMKAWKDGDDVAMDELNTKDMKEHPELAPVQEKLLYERNIGMAQKLEAYLKGSDTYICAVGSAHLVGKRSIIQILKDKGYKVTQISVGDPI